MASIKVKSASICLREFFASFCVSNALCSLRATAKEARKNETVRSIKLKWNFMDLIVGNFS